MWGVLLTVLLLLSLLVLINSSLTAILFYLLLVLIIGFIITRVVQNCRPSQQLLAFSPGVVQRHRHGKNSLQPVEEFHSDNKSRQPLPGLGEDFF